MKKLYLRMFSMILALSAIMFTFSVSSNLFNAKANTNVDFGIIIGAEVRLPVEGEDDMTGIKFAATLSQNGFATITNGKTDPVYFGIELTANGVAKDICYLVDSKEKDTLVNNAIDFNGASEYTYTAAITYNEEILATELAEDEKFNPAGLTVEEFKNSEDFQKYLIAAYSTEITAKAFYRVGNDENAAKTYGVGEVTRSMWGVASYWSEDIDILAEKYFTAVEDAVEIEAIIETGAIDYEFAANDNVYFEAEKIAVTDGVLPASVLEGKKIGDTVVISVVSADGALTKLNVALKSQNVVVEAQAFYDAAADKIYYTEGDVQKTIQGSKDASFAYVVDATTSYALADYSGETMVSNVNYKYADSVSFDTRASGMSQSDTSFGYLMNALQPKLKTASGSIVVNIPYNAHTDVYTGVTLTAKIGDLTYMFTDTIITSQMIDDAAELDSVFNNADKKATADYPYVFRSAYITQYGTITKGVYMLANDIDCATGFKFDNSYWNFFEGVFDGRGYNIYNLNVSGTAAAPGNGLFSATSLYSAIQNVGFINVTANYGSVFQGNQFDVFGSTTYYTNKPTYYLNHGVWNESGNRWDMDVPANETANGLGSIYYRRQLVDDSDTTTTIGALLKSGMRGADGVKGQGGYFQNVYVQITPETQRLMGVISKNMANAANTVRAYNMVIEYLPTQLYDSAEGANDGALPFGYDYTEGRYGVLFGGAYEYNHANGAVEYERDETYFDKNEDGTFQKINYFVPDDTVVSQTQTVQPKGALNFHHIQQYFAGRVNFATKVYVISTVGLVSSAQGSILGTNVKETDDTVNNPYRFVAQSSYYYNPNTHGVISRIDSYASYDEAANAGYDENAAFTNNLLTSFFLDGGAEENYWDISQGYLKWKNVKAN